MSENSTKFTDFALEQDAEGIFDMVLDPKTGDAATVSGMETAMICSLLTDRRAAKDEVPDPMQRRGWDGNLLSPDPDFNRGSGWWLYEQHRLDENTRTGMYFETVQALDWLIAAGLARSVDAKTEIEPDKKRLIINPIVTLLDGGTVSLAWQLWSQTGINQIKNY